MSDLANDPLELLTISGFNAGVISLATNILKWLDEQPSELPETTVIELRKQLKGVIDGIQADPRWSQRL